MNLSALGKARSSRALALAFMVAVGTAGVATGQVRALFDSRAHQDIIAMPFPEAQSMPAGYSSWRDPNTNSIMDIWACAITPEAAAQKKLPLCADTACQVLPEELSPQALARGETSKICMRTRTVDPADPEMIAQSQRQLEFGNNFQTSDVYRFCGFGPRLYAMTQVAPGEGPDQLGHWRGKLKISLDTVRGKGFKEGRVFGMEFRQLSPDKLETRGWLDTFLLSFKKESVILERVYNPPPGCETPPLLPPQNRILTAGGAERIRDNPRPYPMAPTWKPKTLIKSP